MERQMARALAAFGMEDAQIEFLRHNENRTYRLTDASGRRFLLRLHRPAAGFADDILADADARRSESMILGEMRVLNALGAAGLTVQQPRATADGRLAVPLGDVWATLLSWLPGESMEAHLNDERKLEQVGRMTAHMHEVMAAQDWSDVARPRYDGALLDRLAGALTSAARAGVVRENQLRTMLAVLERCRGHMARETGRMMVHADLSATNLIWTGKQVAPIDFGLCGLSCAEMDVGSLLANFPEPRAQRAILRGYDRPVDEDKTACFRALQVMLFVGMRWEHAKSWTWFPDALARWTRDVFEPCL